ncbi:hypothetical protein LCGC14_1220360, partial [marine sediment metagenome]
MSLATAISNTIRRLNLQSFIMRLPVFGQALYDGISEEFNRVNDFRDIVTTSVVPNTNMATETIEDNEKARGIDTDTTKTDSERIDRIISEAQRDGNGGPDWIQDRIRKAGYDLYVLLNIGPPIDPETVPGQLITSSPNGNVGGVPVFGFAYPDPQPFSITADPNRWGYFFFLSPFSDRIALDAERDIITYQDFIFLKKMVMQLKHVRNWAVAQVSVIQIKITTDYLTKLTSDDLIK